MPLSKNIIAKEQAEKVVINYEPASIASVISDEALAYVKNQEQRGDFRVDKIVSEYIGIDELEKESQQREVARQAIEKSKEIQEEAYQKAYELGQQEGKDLAYDEEKENIKSHLQRFELVVNEIEQIKTRLMVENEKQIVNLCFYMAKRLLMKEINEDPGFVEAVVRKALEMAQSEEEVTIRVAPEDKTWIDSNIEELFKSLHLDPSTKFEEDPSIQQGGVVIETNHGVIDATVEQRLEKLEAIMQGES